MLTKEEQYQKTNYRNKTQIESLEAMEQNNISQKIKTVNIAATKIVSSILKKGTW